MVQKEFVAESIVFWRLNMDFANVPFIWKVRVLFKTRLIFPRINGPIEQEGILYAHASIWAVEGPQKHFL